MLHAQAKRPSHTLWGTRLMAMLAVAMLVLAPRGFMISGQAHGPIPLIICGGESASGVSTAPGDKSPAQKSHASACIYSGHGVALDSHELAIITSVESFPIERSATKPVIARGTLPLASPPPPSQGPPVSI